MEDVPQLAVQDLKTKVFEKIKQDSAHCNNRILHFACHLQHQRTKVMSAISNHDFNPKPYVKAPRYDKTSRWRNAHRKIQGLI